MDVILQKFMEPARWVKALHKGVDKDIPKSVLYQLTKEETRLRLYQAVKSGRYEIAPPHTAQIPKEEKDEYRTVYVNEPADRIFLSIANDLLFELMPEMIHKNCKSYLSGTGCGDVVIGISSAIVKAEGKTIGFKADLSKYFDSVPLEFIDDAFNKVETKYGKSGVLEVLRKYYHSNLYFDLDGTLKIEYQSLKQGCAVASWLADVVLRHIDVALTMMSDRDGGIYIRYSDDILYIGKNYKKAMATLSEMLQNMDMKLNPKKVELLSKDKWFKFLGFSIKGGERSMSKTRLKKFQKEIEERTKHGVSYEKAINNVNRFLYKGNGEFSWATSVLKVINVPEDLMTLNNFIMDRIRACKTDHHKVGGLGYVVDQKKGCIVRGKGKNVKANREKTAEKIDGYLTLLCMKNALMTRRAVYNTLVAML